MGKACDVIWTAVLDAALDDAAEAIADVKSQNEGARTLAANDTARTESIASALLITGLPIMPHLIIEYSTEDHGGLLDIAELMKVLHRTAADTGVMQAADIKIRATAFSDYLVAGRKDGFCHVSLYLLEGRTPAQKVAVSEALRAAMAKLLPETRSLSVDVRDMDPVAYKKRLNT